MVDVFRSSFSFIFLFIFYQQFVRAGWGPVGFLVVFFSFHQGEQVTDRSLRTRLVRIIITALI